MDLCAWVERSTAMVKQPEDDIGFPELEEPVVVGSLSDAIKPNPGPLQGEYVPSTTELYKQSSA